VPKPYVPCEEKRKPEWNSLRPYQASPCKVPIVEEEQTLLCGKDFVASQTFKVDVNSPYCSCPSQYTTGEVKCHCNIDRELEISVNSFDSELPIAGNTELTPNDRGNSIAEDFKRLSDWTNHLPPNPSKYPSLKDYYKAYQKWRGKTCAEVTIPIINIKVFFCFNDPLKPDFLSFLFPYIPYSSTEDRIGKLRLSDFVAEKSDDMEIKDLKTEWKSKLDDIRTKKTTAREGVLYFPHLEETAELATVLQSTFVPKDSMSDSKAQSIKSEDVEPVKQQAGCTILDSRYNPGDQLFGEQIDSISEKSKGAPSAKITYKAEFDCPAVWNCSSGNCVLEGECTKTAKFSSQVTTFTPLIDEVWSKTTAGYSSIFRKIMPKTGSNSPYEKIKDIPASTSVEYKVQGEDASSATSNPQLYFPHLGGIYDYFLLGTQTALRPKGFGGSPAGLSSGQTIPEPDLANEYLSWYLNGTLYRAERNPLDHKKLEDLKRITTLSGPLNKLLPQEIQWRNKINTNTLNSQRNEKQQTGKADEVAVRMSQDRHNQIVACIKGIKIPGWIPFIGGIEIGAIPTTCSEKSIASVGQESQSGGGTDPTGLCTSSPAGNSGSPSGAVPGGGYCSQSYLSQFFDPGDAAGASCICNTESGGNPDAINCGCLSGSSFDYSIGLFQINLLAHCDGGAPFDKNPPMCTIKDKDRVIECANMFFDPANNVQKAVALTKDLKSRGYSPWCPWINAAKACGLDISKCP